MAPVDAGEYMYFMGAFMTFTVWMLFVSYRDVPKLYLMRSVQESVFMLFCKMEAVFQVRITYIHPHTYIHVYKQNQTQKYSK